MKFIIDDFQSLANRTVTQAGLLSAMKERVANKKQTIITTSGRIDEIDGISEEMVSFLLEALVVEIKVPSWRSFI